MNPKFNTSLRGRGKWGDFLIAILPLSWCANILLNSNFILRMFEWQNESSLFTIRIHGKQWYWIYKFDLVDIVNILTVPKNMGNNRWVVGTPQELIVCESYVQALQLRAQRDWIKNYWLKKLENDLKTFKNVELGSVNTNKNKLTNTNVSFDNFYIFEKKNLEIINNHFNTSFYKSKFNFFNKIEKTKMYSKLINLNNLNFISLKNWNVHNYLSKFKLYHQNYNLYFKIQEYNYDNLIKLNSLNFLVYEGLNFENYFNKFKKLHNDFKLFFEIKTKMFIKLSVLNLLNFNSLKNWNIMDYINNFNLKFNDYKFKFIKPLNLLNFNIKHPNTPLFDFFNKINNFYKRTNMFKFFHKLKNNQAITVDTSTVVNFSELSKNTIKKKILFYDIIEDSIPDFFIFINETNGEIFKDSMHYNHDEIEDTWDLENNIRQQTNTGPIRLVKHFLTQDYFKTNSDLLQFNFFDSNDHMALKVPDNDNFWVLKQKRYKKKQSIKASVSDTIENSSFEAVRNIYKKHIMENVKLITDLDFQMDSYNLYKCMRGNRNRTETLPVHLYRRLLRTKRTLVLPAHINMTVVTNSYDVIHSWFIPGIGVKMDCVPGRATHHSLYLDNIGFYYGQCAEICGRYHHHMPIRICALPFEHFLIWWQIKGIPKLLKLKKRSKNYLINHASLKYSW